MLTFQQLEEFQRLNLAADKRKTAEYLRSILINLTDDEDICTVRWNISDNLAMLRMPEEEMENHKEFEKQVLKMNPKYLYWPVTDSTQRATLYLGGYKEYWDRLYLHALENAPKIPENRIMRFEVNRTTSTVNYMETIYNDEITDIALENMRRIIDEEMTEESDVDFYELIYLCQLINVLQVRRESVDSAVEQGQAVFGRLIDHDLRIPCPEVYSPLIGSWQFWNKRRSPKNYVNVGTTSFTHALINCGRFCEALVCDEATKELGFTRNNYYRNRIQYVKENCKL